VDFAYDKKTETMVLSSVDVFVGDKSLPAISYSPIGKPRKRQLTLTIVEPENGFWDTWWTVTKQYMEEELEHGDVEYADYKGEVENYPFKRLLQDLRNYSFEEAIEDLQEENWILGINYENFLPVSSLPAKFLKKLEEFNPEEFEERKKEILRRLIEILTGKAAQTQQSQSSSSADSPEKQSTEDDSPFEAEIIYSGGTGKDSFEGGLDVSPITFHVCSVFRQLVKEMIYLGPLRSYPERYYTFSGNPSEQVGQSGEMLPDILFQNSELLERVNAELNRFGLGYELKRDILRDDKSNPTNVFALRIVDKETGVSASIRDVGFGVSQVLPVVVQSLLSHNKTLLIEQPEIHLHPALQAELGDLFIQSALGEQQNTFLLETHSEHLMLRILRRIRETTEGELDPGLTPVRPEQVAVLYVLPDKDGAKVVEIPIRPDGEFAERWPQGFFAERAKELF